MRTISRYSQKIALLSALLLWQVLAAGCAADQPSASEKAAARINQGSVLAQAAIDKTELPTVQPGGKVLVMPFDCSILTEDNTEAQKILQAALTSRTLHLLRDAGVQADEFGRSGEIKGLGASDRNVLGQNTSGLEMDDSAAAYSAATFAPVEAMVQPLTANSGQSGQLEGAGQDDYAERSGQVEATGKAGQSGEDAWETVLSAGSAPAQGPEDGVVAEGTQVLEPRDEASQDGLSGQTLGEQLAAPVAENGGSGSADESSATYAAQTTNGETSATYAAPPMPVTGDSPVTAAQAERLREAEARGLLETARLLGYDYVLLGTISYVHAELRPAVRQGRRALSSVRAEFSCSYQLLDSAEGQALAIGATSGKAGQQLSLTRGEAGQAQVENAAGKMIHEALYRAAQNMVRELMDPNAPQGDFGDWESDANYYRDSPGKRLKP